MPGPNENMNSRQKWRETAKNELSDISGRLEEMADFCGFLDGPSPGTKSDGGSAF